MQMAKAEELYQKYFAAVYSVCFLYMKNQADACDMVQETFLRLLQGRFAWQDEEKAKAWLIVTASNCCKSQLRKSWRKKQPMTPLYMRKEKRNRITCCCGWWRN